MKNITMIYPDSSVHTVTALAVQRYRLNGNSFNLLVYVDNGATCITPLVEIGGTLCKIPYHNINFEEAELLGEISPDRLPDVILSAVLLEPGQDMTSAYDQIQQIANQAEIYGQWFSKPQAQAQAAGGSSPPGGPNGSTSRGDDPDQPTYAYAYVDGQPQPVYEHTLFTTYQYDQYKEGLVGEPQVTYEHLFNIFRLDGSSEHEFKKPLLFSEVQDAITRIVHGEKKDSLLEEIPDHTIDMPVAAGTTVADYIRHPDGKVQVALALAQPGVHRYTILFGKCPDKEVYEEASKQEHSYATVMQREYNGVGTEYAFRAGFIGLLPIAIGDSTYDSIYKPTDSKEPKGKR